MEHLGLCHKHENGLIPGTSYVDSTIAHPYLSGHTSVTRGALDLKPMDIVITASCKDQYYNT